MLEPWPSIEEGCVEQPQCAQELLREKVLFFAYDQCVPALSR